METHREMVYVLVDLVVRPLSLLAVPVEMDNPAIHTIRIIRIHFDTMLISVDKAATKQKTKQS